MAPASIPRIDVGGGSLYPVTFDGLNGEREIE